MKNLQKKKKRIKNKSVNYFAGIKTQTLIHYFKIKIKNWQWKLQKKN